jgi:hypothetical protein
MSECSTTPYYETTRHERGSRPHRCDECRDYSIGFAEGLEAAAKRCDVNAEEWLSKSNIADDPERFDMKYEAAAADAASIRALKTSEVHSSTTRDESSTPLDGLVATSLPAEAPSRAGTPSGEANHYHQSLGAKWMCEAIVRWLRTPVPGTLCEDQERDERIADSLVRRWEDERFWRPRVNAEPAGVEHGAGVCPECGGSGGLYEYINKTPFRMKCPRCVATGKESGEVK